MYILAKCSSGWLSTSRLFVFDEDTPDSTVDDTIHKWAIRSMESFCARNEINYSYYRCVNEEDEDELSAYYENVTFTSRHISKEECFKQLKHLKY